MTEERKTLDQLADELESASKRWHGSAIQHVNSDGRYKIVGVHFRESDMALCVEYTPLGGPFNNCVKFARSIDEMDFGTRFVFVGGAVGNAELDAGTSNHLDHGKRGFEPK